MRSQNYYDIFLYTKYTACMYIYALYYVLPRDFDFDDIDLNVRSGAPLYKHIYIHIIYTHIICTQYVVCTGKVSISTYIHTHTHTHAYTHTYYIYIQTLAEMYYSHYILLLYDCAVVVDIIEVYDYYSRSDGHPLISALRQTVRR